MNLDIVLNNLKAVKADDDPKRQAVGLVLALHEIATWLDTQDAVSDVWTKTKVGDELSQIAYQDEIESYGEDELQELWAHGYDTQMWLCPTHGTWTCACQNPPK